MPSQQPPAPQQTTFNLLSRQYASAPPVPGMHFPSSDFASGSFHASQQQQQQQQQQQPHNHHVTGGEASSFHGPSSHHNLPPTSAGLSQQQTEGHGGSTGFGTAGGHDRSLMDEAFYQGAGALFFKGSAEEDLPEDLRHDEIFSDNEEDADGENNSGDGGGGQSDMVVEDEAMMMSHWQHSQAQAQQQRGERGHDGMDG
jgi:hypothetical protein